MRRRRRRSTAAQWRAAPFFKQHHPRGSCGHQGRRVLVGKTAWVCIFWREGISPTCTLLPSPHHPANFPYARAGKAESLWDKNSAGRWWFIYASRIYHRWRRWSCSFRLLEAPGQQDRREEGRPVFTNNRLASLPPVVCFTSRQHSLHPRFTFAEAGWPTFLPAWPCCGRRPHHGHLSFKMAS